MNRRLPLVLLLAPLASPPVAGQPASTPDDLEATVATMARIGACWSPSFSPDGRRLAFVSNLSGLPQVWTVAAEEGWPDLVTALADPVGSVAWSPDGAWLAFTVAPGGGMNEQVYLVRPDGSGLRRLTDGGKETNRLGRWTHDGGALVLGSNRRTGAAIDPYLFDVASGAMRLVVERSGINSISDVSRDGRRAILFRLLSRGDNDLFLLDLPSGRESRLTPHEGPGSFSGVFGPDGRTVYLSSNKDRELTAFARLRLGPDGQPGPIEVLASRDDAELQGFEIDDEGRTAALAWNVAGRSDLSFLQLAGGP